MRFADLAPIEQFLVVVLGLWTLFGWLLGPTIWALPYEIGFGLGLAYVFVVEPVEKWWRSRGSPRRTRA